MDSVAITLINTVLPIVLPAAISAVAVGIAILVKRSKAIIASISQAHLSAANYQLLLSIANTAVRAVEQSPDVQKTAANKRAVALQIIQSGLDSAGVKGINALTVESALEAAVFTDLNWNGGKTHATDPAPVDPTPAPTGAETSDVAVSPLSGGPIVLGVGFIAPSPNDPVN